MKMFLARAEKKVTGFMVDEIKLREAIKKNDGWWASIFSAPLANYLLRFIADFSWITPNHVTVFSLIIGIVASICFLIASPFSMIIGAILVQLSFIVDCMDGQLARYRQQFSVLGAWLDRVSDRVKDFFYFFTLALGFFLHNPSKINYSIGYEFCIESWLVWPVAMLAMFSVFLIDYYVNQDMKLLPENFVSENPPQGNSSVSSARVSNNLLLDLLSFGKMVYQKIPILRFNIGEQALLITLFAVFNASFFLLLFFATLGTLYVFYWPVAKLKGFTVKKS